MSMKRVVPGKKALRIAGLAGVMMMGFVACHNARYQIINDKRKATPQNIVGNSKDMTDLFHANIYGPLEIFFAVDTSSSLIQERQMLQNNMKSFIKSFSDTGFETVRINIIGDSSTYDAKDCPRTNNFTFPADVGNLRRIEKCIGSYNMISRMTEYFHGTPAPELMKDALVEVIMVSDDNGEGKGNLAADFDPKLADRTIRVSGVVGVPDVTKPTSQCRVAMYGLEAIKLAGSTGGTVYDICNPDWSKLLSNISSDIQKANAGYALKGPIDPAKPIVVSVNGAILPSTSYAIDTTRYFLTFTPGYQLPLNATIEVKYAIIQ